MSRSAGVVRSRQKYAGFSGSRMYRSHAPAGTLAHTLSAARNTRSRMTLSTPWQWLSTLLTVDGEVRASAAIVFKSAFFIISPHRSCAVCT